MIHIFFFKFPGTESERHLVKHRWWYDDDDDDNNNNNNNNNNAMTIV